MLFSIENDTYCYIDLNTYSIVRYYCKYDTREAMVGINQLKSTQHLKS